jgi:transcriptional regulator of acetoin/glycerol metabolism
LYVYYFLYEHIYYKLYVQVISIFSLYEKQENKRMLNTNLMKEGKMEVPS